MPLVRNRITKYGALSLALGQDPIKIFQLNVIIWLGESVAALSIERRP